MRLVLGLVALATALSSAAGTGHSLNSGQAKAMAEPTVTQTKGDNVYIQDKKDVRVIDFDDGIGGGLGGHLLDPSILEGATAINLEIEGNDTFQTATDLTPYLANGWDFTHYSSSGSPTLSPAFMRGNITNEDDEDWYTFTLWGKADITIDLSGIPSECDYDLKLFRKANVPSAQSEQVTQIGSSTWGSNHSEQITKRLYAGVYYIKVYSFIGYGYTKYNLNVSGNYVRNDVCIEDMMANGHKAAIWFADYDPFGMKPTTDLNSQEVGSSYYQNVSHSNDYNHYHPEFPFATTHSYKHAELFVWDHTFRGQLRNVVYRMLQQAEANYTNAVNLYMKAQQAQSGANCVITIFGTVAGSIIPYVSWAIAATTCIIELFNMLFPEGNRFERYTDIIDYIGDLHTALEYDAYTSDTEVVRVPIRYNISSSSTTGLVWPGTPGVGRPTDGYTSTTHTISYAPAERQWNYLYDDGGKVPGQRRYIHAIDHEGQSPFVGTIYPITFNGDVKRAFDSRIARDVNIPTISVNENKQTGEIYAGEYTWFKFTAPHAGDYRIRSAGDTNAAVHVYDHLSKETYPYAGYDGIIAREYRTPGYDVGFSYDFHLNAGETRYFRVCGSVDSYQHLYNTTVTLTEIAAGMVARFDAEDFGLPNNLNNPFFFGNLSNPCNVFYSSCGAFYNAERGAIELLCDRDNNKPFAYIIMFFGRPIKQLNFGSCIRNNYSYACLGLYLQGLNQYGFPVTEDVVSTYCNSDLLPYGLRYDNRDEAICGVMFRIDPETDTSPYHVGYQEQLLGNFVVEFAD